jgi:hydrogenase expression/formation protein HypE
MMPFLPLPLGKLPPELLSRILSRVPTLDKRVLLGPGLGLDCAVLDFGETLLVIKSDPITFATDQIGWYLVQVNANDIATAGATPRWLLVTALLPEDRTTPAQVEGIANQVYSACQELGISVIGGHSEITNGLDHPILVGTLIGEVERQHLITPRGALPGDRLLLTKGVPIEATAILAREFPDRLRTFLSEEELAQAQDFLHHPGISILRDAQIACRSGKVTAMHDPTEGGLASALWELADASGHTLIVDLDTVPIPPLSTRICQALNLNPLASIASGALLFTTSTSDSRAIQIAMDAETIPCVEIGSVEAGPAIVYQKTPSTRILLPRPDRDEIAKLFT